MVGTGSGWASTLNADPELSADFTFVDLGDNWTYASVQNYVGVIVNESDHGLTTDETDALRQYYDAGGAVLLGMDDVGSEGATEQADIYYTFGVTNALDGDFYVGTLNTAHPIAEDVTLSDMANDNDHFDEDGATWVVRGDDGNDYVLARDATARTVIFGERLDQWWSNGNQQLVRNAIEWSTQTDVPWLSEDPISGTVSADGTYDVEVTFTAFPTMTFGTYTATLLVDTDDAVNDPIGVPVTMTISPAPACGFESSSPDEWRETTYFTNTTIGATPLTYTWDFGDGTPVSTLENPTHTYAHVGFYTVVLTATNAHGTDVCSDTVSIEGVEGGFTSNSPVDLGQATIFTNTTLANPSIQQYFWTFGDSTSSEEEHPTHTYAAPGIYTVTLFASNVPGVLNVYDIHQETVEVHAATSYGVQVAPRTATAEGVSAVPVFYTLQVDNTGNISETFDIDAASNWTTTVPSAIGPLEAGEDSNIVVTVTIPSTALDGAADSSIITVASQTDPNQSVTAVLTTTSRNRYSVALAPASDTQSAHPSDLVTYTLRVTNTGNTGDMLTTTLSGYNWTTSVPSNIGALDSGEGKDVEVVVEIPSDAQDGDHDNVIVTVASQNDHTKADTSTLTTTAALPCDDVGIDDLQSDSPVTLGDPMHFTATVTGTTPITYTWDFDSDGTPEQTGTGLDVISHTYSSAGTYTVTLDVENECSTDTHTITISATPVCTNVANVALSQVTRGTLYTDTAVLFEADIAPDDAAKPYTYTINYGDGISSTTTSSADPLIELTHTFTATGSYNVQIAVWNCEMTEPVTDSVQVIVSEYGACVDLTAITIKGDTTGYSGAYTFTTAYSPSNATLPITYTWDNGDTTSTTLRVLDVGTHTLRVTATNISTTWVTDTHTINLQPISPEPKIYLPLVLKNQ